MNNYRLLENIFEQYTVLNNIKILLDWDSNVNLPSNALKIRAKQNECLDKVRKSILNDKHFKNILDSALKEDLNILQHRNLYLMKLEYEENNLYPISLQNELSKNILLCESKWRLAKEKNNFRIVSKELSTVFNLVKEKYSIRSDWLGKTNYEAAIDYYSPGLKMQVVDKIFNDLKNTLPSLVKKILAKQVSNGISSTIQNLSLNKASTFDSLSCDIAKLIGFDFRKGRMDKSIHPFCSGFKNDVRFTHHFKGNNFISALYAVIHEVGHGLYIQGLPLEWQYQPVGQFYGYAFHEASALLYEFFIGQSDFFMNEIGKLLRKYVDKKLTKEIISSMKYIKQDNPIRIDADIVTYPLHIILRYEIEKKLFSNELKVDDIPEYWKVLYQDLFDKELTTDEQGCLQDVHWYIGHFGYFPSYCIGLLIAAQIYDTTNIADLKTTKDLLVTRDKLQNSFYGLGASLQFNDLIKKVAGGNLNSESYYKLVKKRFL